MKKHSVFSRRQISAKKFPKNCVRQIKSIFTICSRKAAALFPTISNLFFELLQKAHSFWTERTHRVAVF